MLVIDSFEQLFERMYLIAYPQETIRENIFSPIADKFRSQRANRVVCTVAG